MVLNNLINMYQNFREMYYRHIQGGRGGWRILSAIDMSYIFQKESDGIAMDVLIIVNNRKVDSVVDKEV